MQPENVWLSFALGAILGLLYIVASFVSNRHALRSADRFMIIVVTTMLIRIVLALVALIGIMLLLPVSPAAFMGSFFVIFVIGLILEMLFLHRNTPGADDRSY